MPAKAALSSSFRDAITLQPAIVALLLQLRSAKGALSLLRSTKLVSRQCYLRFGPRSIWQSSGNNLRTPKNRPTYTIYIQLTMLKSDITNEGHLGF